MVKLDGRYLGELRCEVTHGPSGARLLTDAPVDNMGRGEAFSPTDLVGAALGTCIVTILGIVAKRRGIELGDVRFSVEKHMVADPLRRIARLPVTIHLPASLDDATRRALEQAARTVRVQPLTHA